MDHNAEVSLARDLGQAYVALVEEATQDDTALSACLATTTAALGEMIGQFAVTYGVSVEKYLSVARRGIEVVAKVVSCDLRGHRH